MRQTLQRSISISLFFLLFSAALILSPENVTAQTTLSSGDLVIITVNTDGDKTFDFVPLVDLEQNTEIKFTDAPYIAADSELADVEGTITYTAPGAVSAGTVLTYTGLDENGFISSGSFNLADAGDNIIAFQGQRSSPTYLYGVGWGRASSVWEYSETSPDNQSDVPPGLGETDNTILSLGTADNTQYDARNGFKGTTNSILSSVSDEANWNEDDESTFLAFSSAFTLVDAPAIAFAETDVNVSEEDGTVNLKVELVEAGNSAVDVEVAFLNNSSTADASDIDNYSTQTVTFEESDTSGTTQTVAIDLTTDSNFEGREQAVFQLQNISAGTIIEPRVLTLTLEDIEAPDIVINEIHIDPTGSGRSDENKRDDSNFIEFVNNENRDIDISGWTVSDGISTRHQFAEGTVIPAGRALVLFGDDTLPPTGGFGGAIVQSSNQSPELGLSNGSDTIELRDPDGNIIVDVTFDSDTYADQSLTRNPDITGSFAEHSTVSGSGATHSSPGTKSDGTAFGTNYATGIRGSEGWRMISTPTANTTFDELFGDLWMQGVSGSNDPGDSGTIYSWSEADTIWTAPASMTDELDPGKGYIVYLFEDDEFNTPGIQGGFPKVINTDGEENNSSVSVEVTANDADDSGRIDGDFEGWNLLGNPFGTDISVTSLLDALESAHSSVNANIYVWDHNAGGGQGSFIELGAGDKLAPFQAFFVRYTTDGVDATANINRSDLAANNSTEFLNRQNEPDFAFSLSLSDGEFSDRYFLEFGNRGDIDLDRYDAYKLFSLNPDAINVYGLEGTHKLLKKVLPSGLDERLEIPLGFDAPERDQLTFSWEGLDDLPADWDVVLIDREHDMEIDLTREREYNFFVRSSAAEKRQLDQQDNRLLNKQSNENEEGRFVIAVTPAEAQREERDDTPNAVKLNPNYPNPFNPTTTISYTLDQDARVEVTIWNIVGQKVATLVDEVVEAGEHEEVWNASDMPSGMYITQLEVNGTVEAIRKMTLIK